MLCCLGALSSSLPTLQAVPWLSAPNVCTLQLFYNPPHISSFLSTISSPLTLEGFESCPRTRHLGAGESASLIFVWAL